MTIPVPIATSLIAAGVAIFIVVIGALFSLSSRLGRVEKGLDMGLEMLAAEIRASRERSDMQYAAVEERAIAREEQAIARENAIEERAIAREEAIEERAIARHNELLAEIRLWRTHGHDADGNIFFRVPE